MSFRNPDFDSIRRLLDGARTIALVGYSPREDRPSHRIAARLKQVGYRVIPVRPGLREGLGETAYADLRSIPESIAIDLVDVFRAAESAPAVVADCLARRVPAGWFQDGIVHEAAALEAQASGITVVMDRCIWRDYRSLHP